ncbi:tRNA (N6-threonylcarbamoyladenosine(37)-N6)-methyltransferase TrmO [Trinickia soli]|jgi:tRNA-Thr(GGU) m(6)t(6)A37 methyltransferase TsaA|uniref:tRNA (N6-threonylcarbamoyladenosine(37)-N6)-methyltransferase TrmO n=1 Tax=Trinickia soli TaxID=380675 RepID=A0A2N7VLE0_9BURK|nr:tRNA (N6-threonylcarbamoyladenosine(37)-N6)-methyltransferase TrmO [Trinickia soli]KAA0091772.1 tRNA (N6-threonylcarbamoyladenosine(37)-N6)-methyltransferase TrmO [Paraburkholderia sp. T12-10]PMS17982.1 tRNA (N6-threonylcarbamoyladenosine(37)-N6)-methyltransferase TrmO [Trinickia soli]CAB3722548.1 S-adenosyl-L-methionine-binding protein [Trinickia soli]
MPQPSDDFALTPIGYIRSTLGNVTEAPHQGTEGAPDAWIELDPKYVEGLTGLSRGNEILVLAWFHRADRSKLVVHPRGERDRPLTGVFATRSPHRPNPIGLHRVTIREIAGNRLQVGPIEAIDGTPIVDIKIVIGTDD